MVFLSVFLFNLLCGLVPCDPSYRAPDINPDPLPLIGFRGFSPTDDLIVKTNIGKVQGYMMKTTQGAEIVAFEGIPFAESTEGENRFRPPKPKTPWKGVYKAHKAGEYCMQYSFYKLFRVVGSEDCLHLSIYTNQLPGIGVSKLPVIVYFHGGSYFMGGENEYGPSYILDAPSPVILVTVNYRLGILGFLSTGDEQSPGNYGLKDQALALKWVYENIQYFSGDKTRITIFGSSAGAASVQLHYISNVTRGYFQNGFAQSASAFNHWSIQPRELARQWTNRLARLIRCPTENSTELMVCIRRTNPYFLTVQTARLFDWFPLPPVLFAPTIEPDIEGAFITMSPEEAYAKNLTSDKPLIVTMTKDEGYTGIFVTRLLVRLHVLKNNWDKLLRYWLQFDYITNSPQEITDKITKFYIGDQKPSTISNDQLSEMATDRYFYFGIHKGLQAHAQVTNQTYAYLFNYRGIHNLANVAGFTSNEWGIGHGEDAYYFFNSSFVYEAYKRDEPDYKISQLVINLVTNFADKGVPLYTNEEGEDMKIWEPVGDPKNMKFLQIDKEVKMIDTPFKDRLRFWNSLKLRDTVPLIPI